MIGDGSEMRRRGGQRITSGRKDDRRLEVQHGAGEVPAPGAVGTTQTLGTAEINQGAQGQFHPRPTSADPTATALAGCVQKFDARLLAAHSSGFGARADSSEQQIDSNLTRSGIRDRNRLQNNRVRGGYHQSAVSGRGVIPSPARHCATVCAVSPAPSELRCLTPWQ